MATPLRLLFLLLFASLFTACAYNFTKPDLPLASYAPAGSMESRLDFDISREPVAFQEQFARRLDKRNVVLYALRVGNPTKDTVWLDRENLQLMADSTPIAPVAPRVVYRALRQPVAIHALWFLLGPIVRTEGEEKVLDYHPLGAAAAAWGIRNGIVAYQANQEVKEMMRISMPAANVPLPPTTTIYLLLPLPESTAGIPLQLRYLEDLQRASGRPTE